MFRKLSLVLIAFVLIVAGIGSSLSSAKSKPTESQRVRVPLNIAILIQDDLTSQVGNELGVTKDFIRSLRAGSLDARQPFTDDLNRAANSLRVPIASASAAPYNPYVEVIEALKKFDSSWKGPNTILLISDGLDVSRGFDTTSAGHTMDIDRSIKEANKRNVAIYSFYAPSVGLTRVSSLASAYGQSSLSRVSHETGGMAFFQGLTGFVTFHSYFDRLRAELNRQYGTAS